MLRARSGTPLAIGVSCGRLSALRESYRQSLSAQKIAFARGNGLPVAYEQLGLELLLSEVSAETCNAFEKKIWGGAAKDSEELLHLLRVYYQCSGSIEKTAQALFLHKNTVQYQLKKLTTLTGYDPRDISCAALYQMLLLISQGKHTDKPHL